MKSGQKNTKSTRNKKVTCKRCKHPLKTQFSKLVEYGQVCLRRIGVRKEKRGRYIWMRKLGKILIKEKKKGWSMRSLDSFDKKRGQLLMFEEAGK